MEQNKEEPGDQGLGMGSGEERAYLGFQKRAGQSEQMGGFLEQHKGWWAEASYLSVLAMTES